MRARTIFLSAAAALLGAWCAGALAAEPIDLTASKAALADPAAVVGAETAAGLRNPAREHDKIKAEVTELVERSSAAALGGMSPIEPQAIAQAQRPVQYRLFLTLAMREDELKSAIAIAREHEDLTIVFRGLLPGQTLGQFQQRLAKLVGAIDKDGPSPSFQLDPPAFADAKIAQAPTLARYDNGALTATVAGLMHPDWLASQVASGRSGDLGKRGPVVDVAEPDLIEVLKARAAKIDWAADKAKALKSFWARQQFEALPPARAERTRALDPTFEVAQDVRTPDGTLIARKGELVNPLDRMPFTQRLIVFDPFSPKQIEIARRELAAAGDRRVTLMATQVDREEGLDALARLSESFGQPVYLLPKILRERFDLEFVPSTVDAVERHFVIHELPVL